MLPLASATYLIIDVVYFKLLGSTYGDIKITRYWAAALVYLLYPVAILFFVVRLCSPDVCLRMMDLWRAFFFGLTVYGVYNLTNLATLPQWTIPMAIQDTLWGGLATCVIAQVLHRWGGGDPILSLV